MGTKTVLVDGKSENIAGENSSKNNIAQGEPVSYLAKDYQYWQDLFSAQPALVRRFLENQASLITSALIEDSSQVRFMLPDRVVVDTHGSRRNPIPVPTEEREQLAGGLRNRLARSNLNVAFRQRLAELESSTNTAVTASAGLIRYSTAHYMVHLMLPSGRNVTYSSLEGDLIPSVPVGDKSKSAITALTDAIAEGETGKNGDEDFDDRERGELLVPYVPAAQGFYLPQWVAFDDNDHLLVNSVGEAEAYIASMQRFLAILHRAVALAPYMVVDSVYQMKRYGILGQLVNQGRALARFETEEIIRTIQRRVAAQDLNRGLNLSLPYFDDQDMLIKNHNFAVIPAGRVMFVPAFVVRAVIQEQGKVAQDTRLSPSTRKHLYAELETLGEAFLSV